MSKFILYTFFFFTFFACSPSESTKKVNAENINTGDFENTESQTEVPTQTVSNTEILEKDYYRFKGTINENLPIVLDLNQENGNYVGSYYYTKHKMILRFDGKKNENGEIVLQVYDKLGNIVEYITGRINQNTFIGKWQNAAKTKTFPISLTETLDRSILFYVDKLDAGDYYHYEVLSIRQVPKDGDLTHSQKKIFELQRLDISTNNEINGLLKKLEKASKKESRIGFDPNSLYKKINIVFNDFSIAIIRTDWREHHSGSSTHFDFSSYYIIDAQKGKEITLESIFDEENMKVIEEKVRKKAEDEEAFDGYSVHNFMIGERGVTFIFNENPSGKAAGYGAYEGREMPQDYVMNWSEIENLIKEDSPVRRIFEN